MDKKFCSEGLEKTLLLTILAMDRFNSLCDESELSGLIGITAIVSVVEEDQEEFNWRFGHQAELWTQTTPRGLGGKQSFKI